MKEVTGNTRKLQACLLRKFVIDKNEITDQKQIANEFNAFFKR